MHYLRSISLLALLLCVPFVASAQMTFETFLREEVVGVIDGTIVVVIGLALLFFLWGLAKFILKAGDPRAQEEGKSIMLWGIIALTVMIGVWGLVRFAINAFGLNPNTDICVPDALGNGCQNND